VNPDNERPPDRAAGPVAVIGAGRMGAAMAVRLAGAGVPVTLYNRTRARAEKAAAGTGAEVAATAREAAAAATTVIVSLADDAALRSVYSGPDGLLAGLTSGDVVLETSTVDPETVRELAPAVARREAVLLDSPVSGSVPLVERGELTVMVGGDPQAAERARPVFDVLARRVFHLGPTGAGATMKLAVNSVVHALNLALAEALVLAERAGIERSAAYEVFASSAVAAPFVLYKRAAFERPDETPVAFMLDLVGKDLALIDDLARRVGVPMDQMSATRSVVAGALAAGMGEQDISALAVRLRDLAHEG
jgi:3-hydroxyisobutyrate dehydrogenase-like beta-hydroxyacid dehydrogenase